MHFQPYRRSAFRFLTAILAATTLAACAQEPAPDLPPGESMELPTFFDSDASANATAATNASKIHITTAAIGVAATNTVLYAALIAPYSMYAANLGEQPTPAGAEWVWSRDYPQVGVTGDLFAGVTGDTLNIRMEVNGAVGGQPLNDFVWFTGSHKEGEGKWTLFAPNGSGALLDIDWAVVSSTQRGLLFTNRHAGTPGEGDAVLYIQNGADAEYHIHDARNAQGDVVDFIVFYNLNTGAGRLNINGADFCWDTFSNDQQDIPCS